jgi:DNA-binding transcriptional ArsR family regulator
MKTMTVQDPSVLLFESGAQLTDRPLDDYAALLRSDDSLERGHLDAIHYAARHRVLESLARESRGLTEPDELTELFGQLRRLAASALDDYRTNSARLQELAALVDGRLKLLARQEPERALDLLHARSICEFVRAEGVVPQGRIQMQFDLRPANLSRILGVLESHELIGRRKHGRTKDVFPGRRLEEALGPAEKGAARKGAVGSGRSYFTASA